MQQININELKPHPRNNEFFDDMTGDAWDAFKESISTSGIVEPIVVTQDMIIVSGHQRVRAAKELTGVIRYTIQKVGSAITSAGEGINKGGNVVTSDNNSMIKMKYEDDYLEFYLGTELMAKIKKGFVAETE